MYEKAIEKFYTFLENNLIGYILQVLYKIARFIFFFRMSVEIGICKKDAVTTRLAFYIYSFIVSHSAVNVY